MAGFSGKQMSPADLNTGSRPAVSALSESGNDGYAPFQGASMRTGGQSAELPQERALERVSQLLNGLLSPADLQKMESFGLRISLVSQKVHLTIPRSSHSSPRVPSGICLSDAEKISVQKPTRTRLRVSFTKKRGGCGGDPVGKLDAWRTRDRYGRTRYDYSYRTTNPRSERPAPQPERKDVPEVPPPQASPLRALMSALGLAGKEGA